MAKHVKDLTHFVGGGILYFGDTLGILRLVMLEVLVLSTDNSEDGTCITASLNKLGYPGVFLGDALCCFF